jgi:hypothetical protein
MIARFEFPPLRRAVTAADAVEVWVPLQSMP